MKFGGRKFEKKIKSNTEHEVKSQAFSFSHNDLSERKSFLVKFHVADIDDFIKSFFYNSLARFSSL